MAQGLQIPQHLPQVQKRACSRGHSPAEHPARAAVTPERSQPAATHFPFIAWFICCTLYLGSMLSTATQDSLTSSCSKVSWIQLQTTTKRTRCMCSTAPPGENLPLFPTEPLLRWNTEFSITLLAQQAGNLLAFVKCSQITLWHFWRSCPGPNAHAAASSFGWDADSGDYWQLRRQRSLFPSASVLSECALSS